ncbi:hypothetical protein J2S08_003298 [Bacillus chungangensis]|uniref:Uncharacterized protein n=1 Tax=Bacillus chungangensis TaxID=587633 RepID=A0ABT9WVT8_9BACI|nr:hypothetical protein [Bacillus chungangensis]
MGKHLRYLLTLVLTAANKRNLAPVDKRSFEDREHYSLSHERSRNKEFKSNPTEDADGIFLLSECL